jgi:hypothetical protein
LILLGKYVAVFGKLVIDVGNMALNLGRIEIIFFGVLCTEFGTVTCQELSTDQVEILCQCYRSVKYFTNGLRIVLSEIGNRIMVWSEPFHQLDVAFTFFLQMSGRSDPVEVAINKESQEL